VWDDWLYNGRSENALRLLRPSEERVIWADIVRSQTDNLLLEVPATAAAAHDAWNLRCAWNLPLDASEWTDSADSETFQVWAREFARRLSINGWLSGAELPAFITDRIDEGAMPVPERVEIAGFLEPTPVQKRLFDSLARRSTEVEERKVPDSTEDAVRVGMIDGDREIRAAAEWARRILENDAEAAVSEFRIGIIVPDLGRCRSRVERVFAEEFHPRDHLRPELAPRRLFNISLGPPLSEYPLIEATFLILGIDPQEIPIEAAGRLLRSPFIQGANEELTNRSLLDGVLRSFREPAVSLEDILGMAEKDDVPYRCPRLAAQLRMWLEGRKSLESSEMPSDLAPALSRLLQAIGWPGDGGLNSAQYQTMAAWNELLSELAGLDSVAGRVRLPAAVGMLYHLAASRQFQPESDPAPVQILGVFEASGLQFDRLWIMGMHDGAWPASTGPDPFLPFRLQRRFDLPRSSPDRELEFTEALTARLLASAPAVVVSYPQREDDSDLRVSPLFSTLPEIGADELGLRFPARYVGQILESSRLETLEDQNGPPCNDTAFGGGTSLFKLQATCPFKAFAELRLGAKALDQWEPGLGELDRGHLIHRVLERIWKQLGSHKSLLATSDDRLAVVVRLTIGAEIHDLSRRRRALRRSRFAAIEQARLEGVITDWLTLEKEREPFTVLEQEESRRVSVGGIDVLIRTDRVDLLGDGGLVILDYKTGECSPSDWVGARPDEPQVPIYAVTADSPVSGVFFGRLKTGKVGFRGLAESEGLVPGVKLARNRPPLPLSETIEDWRAVLNQLGDDFLEGRAAVDPKDRRLSCRYCALPTLCRINEAGRFPDDSGSDDRGSEGNNG
jgi:probable DNA repair protein